MKVKEQLSVGIIILMRRKRLFYQAMQMMITTLLIKLIMSRFMLLEMGLKLIHLHIPIMWIGGLRALEHQRR